MFSLLNFETTNQRIFTLYIDAYSTNQQTFFYRLIRKMNHIYTVSTKNKKKIHQINVKKNISIRLSLKNSHTHTQNCFYLQFGNSNTILLTHKHIHFLFINLIHINFYGNLVAVGNLVRTSPHRYRITCHLQTKQFSTCLTI